MKNYFTVSLFLLLFTTNIFAQCEALDSSDADSFISEKNRLKNIVNEKSNKTNADKNNNSSNNISLGNFESYPTTTLSWATGFSENLAKISVNGKFGYINSSGQIVIKPTFSTVNCFSEELASVEIKDKWGYIDKTGKVVIAPKFDFASPFSEGLALVKVGKL